MRDGMLMAMSGRDAIACDRKDDLGMGLSSKAGTPS